MPVLDFADFMDGDDGRMAQAGGGAGFRVESDDVQLAGQDPSADHLDGDEAIEADLAGPVDDPHAAAVDFLEEFVVAEIPDGAGGVREIGREALRGCHRRGGIGGWGEVDRRRVRGLRIEPGRAGQSGEAHRAKPPPRHPIERALAAFAIPDARHVEQGGAVASPKDTYRNSDP